MTLPYYGRLPNLVSIAALLEAVREGSLRIARFQRRFSWSDRQRVDLLDSIYRGYPIGTLMVWRTRDNLLACEERVAGLPVPGDEALRSAPVKEYVLDGLQRISTLYGALGPALLSEPPDAAHAKAWEVYFDLDKETFLASGDLEEEPEEVRRSVLPLSVILNTTRFLDALESHRADGRPERIAKAEKLLRQINGYQIPILPLITERIDDAVQSFRRLNTAGTPLDTTAILHALLFKAQGAQRGPTIDLFGAFDEIRARVAQTWSPVELLSDELLRHLTTAELQIPIYSEDNHEQRFANALRASPEVLDRVAEGIACTVTFLRESRLVGGPRVLPYMFQLVLLARALRPRWPLTDDQREAARRWFLATTITHHFASQRRIQGTLKDLEVLLDGAQSEVLPHARTVIPMGRFAFGRARDKALAIRLASLGPRIPGIDTEDPVHDATLLLASAGEAALHALLPARGLDVGNIVLSPESHLPRLRAVIRGAPGTLFEKAYDCDAELLRSHAIPTEALAALRAGDEEGFIQIRGAFLREDERRLVKSLGLTYGGAADAS